jgi:ubiquinol-cytochrome c reductase cytochrome b subunit
MATGGLSQALEERLGFRAPLRRALDRLFPTHWSFLLGEVALFSFLGLVLSGVYLALFYDPSVAPTVYHGPAASFDGRPLPAAFASVIELTVSIPFGLVVRRFHHFAAHFFLAAIVLHSARVYFSGAFRRPREITWWIGLTLVALALVNGFSGYCLPFDVRGGTAIRMMMTTLESVPWMGAWLATFAFGAPFPGPFILGRLYIEHVFIGPTLIAILVAVHLLLVVRLTHTDHPAPGRDERVEVGARLWPEQAARSTALVFFVFGSIALLSAFFPVEAAQAYGPFQRFSSYEPLSPDWYLLWIEGAYRLLPRQLDFHLMGATFTNPFYGAVVLPLLVFGGCAVYPLVDGWVYGRQPPRVDVLDRARDRPFRTALGTSCLCFLILLSLAVLDDTAAGLLGVAVWVVNLIWGIATLIVPGLVFAAVLAGLKRRTQARAMHGPSSS